MEATVAEMNDKINKQQGKIDDYNNEISMLDPNKKARKIERLNANLQSVVEKKKKLENQLEEIQLEFDALKNSNQTYNLRFDPSLSYLPFIHPKARLALAQPKARVGQDSPQTIISVPLLKETFKVIALIAQRKGLSPRVC